MGERYPWPPPFSLLICRHETRRSDGPIPSRTLSDQRFRKFLCDSGFVGLDDRPIRGGMTLGAGLRPLDGVSGRKGRPGAVSGPLSAPATPGEGRKRPTHILLFVADFKQLHNLPASRTYMFSLDCLGEKAYPAAAGQEHQLQAFVLVYGHHLNRAFPGRPAPRNCKRFGQTDTPLRGPSGAPQGGIIRARIFEAGPV